MVVTSALEHSYALFSLLDWLQQYCVTTWCPRGPSCVSDLNLTWLIISALGPLVLFPQAVYILVGFSHTERFLISRSEVEKCISLQVWLKKKKKQLSFKRLLSRQKGVRHWVAFTGCKKTSLSSLELLTQFGQLYPTLKAIWPYSWLCRDWTQILRQTVWGSLHVCLPPSCLSGWKRAWLRWVLRHCPSTLRFSPSSVI